MDGQSNPWRSSLPASKISRDYLEGIRGQKRLVTVSALELELTGVRLLVGSQVSLHGKQK